MYSLIRKVLIAFVICLLLIACEEEDKLTESGIRAMVDDIENAAENYDANRIGGYLSESFVCDMSIMTPAGELAEQMTKKEYLVKTTEGWAATPRSAYHYSSTINSIQINGDSAVVTSTQEETISAGYGQRLTLHSNVISDIRKVNDQLLIEKIKINARM